MSIADSDGIMDKVYGILFTLLTRVPVQKNDLKAKISLVFAEYGIEFENRFDFCLDMQ